MTVDITRRSERGFHQYGNPVLTSYGDKVEIYGVIAPAGACYVEVYESSSASGPHCWLRIFDDDGTTGITDQRKRDMVAHMNVAQAIAVRDRLTAFIDEASTRWQDT